MPELVDATKTPQEIRDKRIGLDLKGLGVTPRDLERALSRGITQGHLRSALALRVWQRIANTSGRSPEEKDYFESTPRVSGRPAWVSNLTDNEIKALDKADEFLEEVRQREEKKRLEQLKKEALEDGLVLGK